MSKVPPSKGPHPHLADLRNIEIRDEYLKPSQLGDYLPNNGKPSIMWMTRRFGCVLCRGWAHSFRAYLPYLKNMGFNVVAIGPEALGVEAWTSGGVDEAERQFWTGSLAVDSLDKNLAAAMQTIRGSFSSMFSLRMIRLAKAYQQRGILGNYQGDGMAYGGIWVFDSDGKCTYGFRQKNFVDFPSPEDIIAEVNLNSQDKITTDKLPLI